jgi:uncharacterized short protein YbdD (DUF466 family)
VTARKLLSGVRWYLREVSGESGYDRYVAHVRRDHADQRVMTRREYARRRQDDRDARPRARCC